MLTRIGNMKDYEFDSNLAVAGPSNIKNLNYNTSKCKTIKEKMVVEKLVSNELSSSDTYSDTDDSYSVNCDEFQEPSSPLDVNIEFCGAISNANDDSSCSVVDIEILEENNNDPNNNLDSIERFQEQVNSSSEPPDNRQRMKSVKCLNIPTPGCSKDFDETKSDHSLDIKLQEEVTQICNLLPKLKYKLVYATLRKNREAENRVELSLWDLLPNKRPTVKFPLKRKLLGNGSSKKSEKISSKIKIIECTETDSSDNLLKYAERNGKQINCAQKTLEDLLSSSDSELSGHLMNDYKGFQSTQNRILQPAKLIHDKRQSFMNRVTAVPSPILSPSKLTYITAPQHTIVNSKNVSKYARCKNKKSVKKVNIPLGRNVFLPPTTNEPMDLYMNYLNFVKNMKKQKLIGKAPNFDFKMRYQVRETYLKPQTANCSVNNSQFRNTTNSSKTLNVVNIDCGNDSIANGLNFENTNTISSTNLSFHNASTNATAINSQNASRNESASTMSENSDLATKTVNLQNLSQNVLSGTAFERKNIALHVESAELTVEVAAATGVDSDILLYPGSSNTTTNSILPCTSAQVISTVTSLDNLLPQSQLSTTRTMPSTVPTVSVAESCSRKHSILSEISDHSTAKILDELSTSSEVDSIPDVVEHARGAVKKKALRNEIIDLSPKFQQMYEELMFVFPERHKDTIKNICLMYFKKEKNGGQTVQIKDLIDFILQSENLYPDKKYGKGITQDYQKETNVKYDQYTYLLSVFPNADSAYLAKVVASMNGSLDSINQFIDTQCENPTYLTREKAELRRGRNIEEQMQYGSGFNVKQFLETIPDPFDYFENPNRQCEYSESALNFLKYRFKRFKTDTLKNLYKTEKYNVTSTARALENMVPDKYPERNIYCKEINPKEEHAFIIHKVQIREYMKKLKEEEKEKKAFEKLKSNNELLECQCCYDNECMPSKCSTCDDGHIFCNSCIIRGIEAKLADGGTNTTCFINCNGEFRLSTLQKILPRTLFSILINKKQEAEVMAAGLEGLVSCPFCHFAYIPPPEDKVFKCLNVECMKESCRLCREPDHVPLKCHNEKIDRARLFVEEKMTEALVRKCYKCSRPYYKEHGCNKIQCQCGATMCYICDAVVTGYNHFHDSTSTFSKRQVKHKNYSIYCLK
ncbi:uncharacterized protein LOC143342687 isoform X2 [Colletes latitarsis]|uniref:uncharacterized protein LOC143342687 isoform X2 n=1 Tax=Colletes latitarsis TaxID=2605962 RepID=UPI0040372732